MSWLGKLLGREPPRIPEGCRAAVVLDGDVWHVAALDGADTLRKAWLDGFSVFGYKHGDPNERGLPLAAFRPSGTIFSCPTSRPRVHGPNTRGFSCWRGRTRRGGFGLFAFRAVARSLRCLFNQRPPATPVRPHLPHWTPMSPRAAISLIVSTR